MKNGIDPDKIKGNLKEYSSEVLCDMIVCSRYLNYHQEIAISCMEELSDRRINGSNFNFEEYIDNALKEMPDLNFTLPDLGSSLRQIAGKLGNSFK